MVVTGVYVMSPVYYHTRQTHECKHKNEGRCARTKDGSIPPKVSAPSGKGLLSQRCIYLWVGAFTCGTVCVGRRKRYAQNLLLYETLIEGIVHDSRDHRIGVGGQRAFGEIDGTDANDAINAPKEGSSVI